MFQVFKDPLLQKTFDRKGYIVQSALLDGKEVNTLIELFDKFKEEYSGPFHTTHFSTNTAYKKQVHDTIVSQVYARADKLLNHFRPLFGNFMIKNPDPDFAMDLHADWAYVDEQQFSSVAIWIPLVDVNTENGCLGVIEGSHKITNSIRGPMIIQSSRELDKGWASRYGKLLPIKAGDAIFYNHRLLHYSPPNKTKVPRPALNLSLAPAEIPLLHYCLPEGSTEIEMYSVSDASFFIHYNNFQRPEKGELIKKLPRDTVKFIDEKMEGFWKNQILNRVRQWL